MPDKCPKCNGELESYPDGRKCGCVDCKTVFRLPGMEIIFSMEELLDVYSE